MIPLFDWPAQRPKCFKNCVTKNPELFQDIPNLVELPFVRYALWSKSSMITTTSRLFPIDNVSEDSYLSSYLALDDKIPFFAICDWSFLVPIIWPKGLSRLYGNLSFWPRFSHFQKFSALQIILA